MTISSTLDAKLDLQISAALGKLTNPTNRAEHEQSERDLEGVLSRSADCRTHVLFDGDFKPFWGLTYDSDRHALIIPLRMRENDEVSDLNYERCAHDIVAIHQDTLPAISDIGKWRSALNALEEHYERCFEGIRKHRCQALRHQIRFVLFEDSDELLEQLRTLDLPNEEREREEASRVFSTGEAFEENDEGGSDDGLYYRSLHLLLPRGHVDQISLNGIASFYLNVMRIDCSVDAGGGGFASRTDFHPRSDDSMMIGDFIGLFNCFIIATLRFNDNRQTSVTSQTRERTIDWGITTGEVRGGSVCFTGEELTGVDMTAITSPMSLFSTFDELFRSPRIPSELATWVEQANFRIFGRPLQSGGVIDHNWQVRGLFERITAEVRGFEQSLRRKFSPWRDEVCKLDSEYPAAKQLNLGNNRNNISLKRFGEAIKHIDESRLGAWIREMRANGEVEDSLRLAFYARVIGQLVPIQTKVYGAAHINDHWLFLQRFRVYELMITLLGIHPHVVMLGQKVSAFRAVHPDVGNEWAGFGRWELEDRQT